MTLFNLYSYSNKDNNNNNNNNNINNNNNPLTLFSHSAQSSAFFLSASHMNVLPHAPCSPSFNKRKRTPCDHTTATATAQNTDISACSDRPSSPASCCSCSGGSSSGSGSGSGSCFSKTSSHHNPCPLRMQKRSRSIQLPSPPFPNHNTYPTKNIVPTTVITTTSIDTLPEDILLIVFRKCTRIIDLMVMRAVCRRWRYLIKAQLPDLIKYSTFEGMALHPAIVYNHDHRNRNNRSSTVGKLTMSRSGPACAEWIKTMANCGSLWALLLQALFCDHNCRLPAISVNHIQATSIIQGITTAWKCSKPPPKCHWVALFVRKGLESHKDTYSIPNRHCGPSLVAKGALVALMNVKVITTNTKTTATSTSQDSNSSNSSSSPTMTPFCWRLEHLVLLNHPITCSGFFGLWDLSQCMAEMVCTAAQHSKIIKCS